MRISIIAAFGGFLFGFDSAVINDAVGAIQAEFRVGPFALGVLVAPALLGAALAVAGFVQWTANWTVTATFPSPAAFSLGFAYGVYAFFALLSLAFTLKMVRETKSMELEDMQD